MVGPADKEGLENLSAWVQRDDGTRKPTVYIASSLTGNDESGVRSKLLHATEYVLRECGFDVYSPSHFTEPGSPHHPNEVTAIDHLHAMEADLIFFIGIQASLGMGIEAHIAGDMLIPWGDAKTQEQVTDLCPLVAGLANGHAALRVIFDEGNVSAFAEKLKTLIHTQNVLMRVNKVRADKETASDIIRRIKFGEVVRRQRLLVNMSLKELASFVDMEPWWIASIEREPRLAECLTLLQFMRLVAALRLRLDSPIEISQELAFPTLVPLDTFDERVVDAANEFCVYSFRQRRPAEPPCEDDEAMLRHWREWLVKTRGLDIPNTPRPTKVPTKKLVGCVAIPLSNLSREQHEKLQSMLHGVCSILEQVQAETGIAIELRCPDFKPDMRHDHGPEIYLATIARLHECDFALTFATPPATGVGIMMRLFANWTLPCLCIAERGDAISRMFSGMYCRHIDETVCFSNTDDVPQLVKDIIVRNMGRLCESAGYRRPVREALSQTCFRELLKNSPQDLKMAYDRMLRSPPAVDCVRPEWIEAFIKTPAMLPNTTMIQFVHIANTLGWRIRALASGVPYLAPIGEMKPVSEPVKTAMEVQSVGTCSVQDSSMYDQVLSILHHAPHGLPTDVLCNVMGMSAEDLGRCLQTSLDSQVVRVTDGVWILATPTATDRLTALDAVIHRTIECLLNCCEYDRYTAYSRRLLKNIPHLCAAASDPMPEGILIRAELAKDDGGDARQRDQRKAAAQAFVRKQMRRREALKPLEYAQVWLIAGRIEGDFAPANKCFEEAIAVCMANRADDNMSDLIWAEVLAQARHACASNSHRHGRDMQKDLAEAMSLWGQVGNGYAAAVASWWCERGPLPERHRRRLERESPLVRMQVIPIYKEKEALAGEHRRRREIRDDVLEQIIAEAKEKIG